MVRFEDTAPSRRVVFQHPEVGPFVAQMARCQFNPQSDTTIGVVRSAAGGEEVIGGNIYTNYTGVACWLHMAGYEGWATRDFLWAAFHYPFEQLGCARVFGVLEEANTYAMQIDLKLGFEPVARIPGMFASGDGVVLCLEREKCRWLRLRPRTIQAGEGKAPTP